VGLHPRIAAGKVSKNAGSGTDTLVFTAPAANVAAAKFEFNGGASRFPPPFHRLHQISGYRPKEPGEHYRIIVAAMREKLRQNPEVKKILLATGDLILKPDHHQEPDAPAAWRYFEIWMQLRAELQKEETEENTNEPMVGSPLAGAG
jgi:hypothetical protein